MLSDIKKQAILSPVIFNIYINGIFQAQILCSCTRINETIIIHAGMHVNERLIYKYVCVWAEDCFSKWASSKKDQFTLSLDRIINDYAKEKGEDAKLEVLFVERQNAILN